MSRALNINATSDHIMRTCAKIGAHVTALETLASGGVRVVLGNAADSAAVKRRYGTKVIAGAVVRQPIRPPQR